MSKGWDNWKGSGIRWQEPGKLDIYLFGDRSEYWKQVDPSSPSEIVVTQNRLVDEVYAIVESRTLMPTSVELFRTGIQHSNRDLRHNYVIWTKVLSHYFDELRPILPEMMSHPKAQVRLSIIQCIDPFPPEPESTLILTKGLQDKSKEVRMFTVLRIRENDQRQLLPALAERLNMEKDPELVVAIQTLMGIFSDGYFIEGHSEDPLKCTVHYGANYGYFIMELAEATPENIGSRLAGENK